jgi:hypothetical protein
MEFGGGVQGRGGSEIAHAIGLHDTAQWSEYTSRTEDIQPPVIWFSTCTHWIQISVFGIPLRFCSYMPTDGRLKT